MAQVNDDPFGLFWESNEWGKSMEKLTKALGDPPLNLFEQRFAEKFRNVWKYFCNWVRTTEDLKYIAEMMTNYIFPHISNELREGMLEIIEKIFLSSSCGGLYSASNKLEDLLSDKLFRSILVISDPTEVPISERQAFDMLLDYIDRKSSTGSDVQDTNEVNVLIWCSIIKIILVRLSGSISSNTITES
jgi:hypothetical protein